MNDNKPTGSGFGIAAVLGALAIGGIAAATAANKRPALRGPARRGAGFSGLKKPRGCGCGR